MDNSKTAAAYETTSPQNQPCGIIVRMGITEIENEIRNLPPEKLNELMDWFVKYHSEIWDARIESDLEEGRLDPLLDEVDAEISSGASKPI